MVAESPEELYEKLTAVWNDEAALIELSRCAYDCGRMHHENMLVRNTLAGDLEALLHDPDIV